MGTIFVDNIKDNVGGKEINIGDGSLSVTSDGKVGINTTSPSDDLEITPSADEKGLTLKTTANIRPYINLESNRSSAGNNIAQINFLWNGTDVARIIGVAGADTTYKDDGHITFATASAGSPDERGRFDNGGRLLLGTTSPIASSNVVLHINADKIATDAGSLLSECTGTGDVFHIHFRNGNGGVGGIKTTSSSTAYVTSSDYRLKENIITDWDATTRLKQLKPSRFNFKADKDTTLDGFLAHEVSSIVPEAITGEKDETQDLGTIRDKDGNVINENVLETQTKKDDGQTWTKTKTEIVYQGIDQSKLVPLLVKTIQELEARVATLESK